MKLSSLQSCAVVLGTASAARARFSPVQDPAASSCKCFPGDACWPSVADWSGLNATVGGRLVKTVPLGAPCHDPSYDEAACKHVQSEWHWEEIHMESSSSVMTPIFANQSCDPFQPRTEACALGNYVRYAVAARGADDVQAAMAFAQRRNLRFVVRNTGHDFLGRSTGAGALAIWTHQLKSIDFLPDYYSDGEGATNDWYRGTAVKLGAGVQGFEIMAAARDRGQVVVGGECATVGVAGGYAQGGGHSALSTRFGLAADNVLAWEVVTADGALRTASRTENADLYWALSGGGGGTYGVVVSMTARTHPDAVVGGASLSFFAASEGDDDDEEAQETFYAGVQAFHEALPAMVDAGTMVVYTFNTTWFSVMSLTGYNMTLEDVQEILKPVESALGALGINSTIDYTQSETYYAHMDTYFGPLPQGGIEIGLWHYGARLIPRAVNARLSETWRFVVEQGATWTGVATDVSSFGSPSPSSSDGSSSSDSSGNSVHPAWREALVHSVLNLPWSFDAPWSDMVAQAAKLTDVIMPAVEAATPGGGAYVNEANWQQPNFQETFWGANYPRLLAIKAKYDPDNFFYTTVGVGSDAWVVAEDGRLCAATGTPGLAG
ncbi:hypothetical protein PG991_008312 [Apiospora marii]|uniref:FAD-binding PCMH-type domain-containing protein n=1 Tax=Apiospora marii TaxID=335849 RepID=A0ABR1RQI4_9PEZI